jgi:hypothetical protein
VFSIALALALFYPRQVFGAGDGEVHAVAARGDYLPPVKNGGLGERREVAPRRRVYVERDAARGVRLVEHIPDGFPCEVA